ncbi:hypothetical protein [Virgisporangium aurantiacum]|uniref:Uncharacterized protein n=1 Tax=Virgisporangium aurantiacum TaxID=175570 RepID=A0A8J3ZL15_9ACTN|nr:hypothetical protein [Virgisporangium aurantiacum]GIJ63441.1 hypothetical protein Vau01_109570 [Virgisporangium aurantiacum]
MEQLIAALVRRWCRGRRRRLRRCPVLPVRRLPADLEAVPVLDLARLDSSGRLSARPLLA